MLCMIDPQLLAPRGASSLGAIAIGLLAEARDAENQTFTVRRGLVSTEEVSARRPIVIALMTKLRQEQGTGGNAVHHKFPSPLGGE